MTKFEPNEILTELDDLLKFCKDNEFPDGVITDINVKTVAYIKNCKKQRCSRNM